MKYFGEGLSEKHKELSKLIRKRTSFDKAVRLFLELHASLHLSEVSGTPPNEVNSLFGDLSAEEASAMPEKNGETICWALWHMARIEDLTMNILVAENRQVLTESVRRKISSPITDTGNALTQEEIRTFSTQVCFSALIAYRNDVGQRTREIVSALTSDDMKRPVNKSSLDAVLAAGGVTTQPDSVWLLDYWGGKDITGLLLMPPTRHLILHLNDCSRWKNMLRKR
ncbi:MAG: DinB family protein [Treponema sp.]|nr:DinB family protein [Treponema sp.]